MINKKVQWAYSSEPFFGVIEDNGKSQFGITWTDLFLVRWDNQPNVQWHQAHELIFLETPDDIFRDLINAK